MTKEVKLLVAVGVITLLAVVGGVWFLTKSFQQNQRPETVDGQVLSREDTQQIGTASAQVKLIEFADYQCPACQAAHPVIKQLLDQYQGQISYTYRHFPLSSHQHARLAAVVVEAAGKQGKFWEMHDRLYERQDEWSQQRDPTSVFERYAAELELDLDQFKDDLEDPDIQAKIDRDISDGYQVGVNATPSFYLNDSKVKSIFSNEFKQQLEQALTNPGATD